MKTLLRKIGFGLVVAVVSVSFAGAFDLAWAKPKPPRSPNPRSNQSRPISSFVQALNQAGGRPTGTAPGKGTNNPKGCASPPCRHHGRYNH